MNGLTNNAYALDLETAGLIHRNKVPELICWSMHSERFKKFGWGSKTLKQAMKELDRKGMVPIFHNACFDVSILRAYGIEVSQWHDTMLMSYAYRTDAKHSLSAWGERLGVPKLTTPSWIISAKRKKGEEPEPMLPLSEYTEEQMKETQVYCAQDTKTTWELAKFFDENLAPQSLQTYFIDLDYSEIILDMERTGCHIDRSALLSLEEKITTVMNALHNSILELHPWQVELGEKVFKTPRKGKEAELIRTQQRTDNESKEDRCDLEYVYKKLADFNPGSADHLVVALNNLYGWKPTEFSEKTGKAKMDKDVLKKLDFPLTKMRTKYTALAKLFSTTVEPLVTEYLDEHSIVRPNFNQCVTITGRLSSSRPNFQNIPAPRDRVNKETGKPYTDDELWERGDYGHFCRRLVCVPNDDWVIIGGDLSNIEARLFAYYLDKYGNHSIAQAFIDGADMHQVNADNWGVSRKLAKTILYASLYGGGANTVSTRGGIPLPEAKKVIEKFHEACPQLNLINQTAMDCVKKNGYAVTLFGRHIHYDYPTDRTQEANKQRARIERQVGNCLFQTAAGDILKRMSIAAAPYVWEADAHFCVQAHDEILVYCPKPNAEALKDKLESVFNQTSERSWIAPVPIVAEFAVGSSWNDTH